MDETQVEGNVWINFYQHFQAGDLKGFWSDTPLSENMRQSLLFVTAGPSGLDLFSSFGLVESDLIKALEKLEKFCLPKIIVMYETYKRSVEKSVNIHSGGKATLDSTHLCNKLKSKTPFPRDAKDCSSGENTVSKNNKTRERKSAAVKGTRKNKKTKLEKLVEASSLDSVDVTMTRDDSSSLVRRSGRSVKVSSRFKGASADMILKAIKPEPRDEHPSSAKKLKVDSNHPKFSVDLNTNHRHQIVACDAMEVKDGESECSINIPEEVLVELYTASGKGHEPPLMCSNCKEIFATKNNLLNHWAQHVEPNKSNFPFQCSLCTEKFSRYDHLYSHYQTHFNVGSNPTNNAAVMLVEEDNCLEFSSCTAEDDGKQLYTVTVEDPKPLAKVNHQKVHPNQRPLSCPVCRVVLHKGQSLSDHMHVHLPKRGSFSCDICSATFPTFVLVQRHVLAHSGIETGSRKSHACLFCRKAFNLEKQLEIHIRKKHKKECKSFTGFQCQDCSKRFKTQELLDFHKLRHSTVKPYSCKTCGKSFLREKGLITHERMHQEGGYICDVCGKSFVNQRVLEEHITIHTGQRPYACDICGKTYRLAANLRYHKLQYHNPSKRVQCPHCPKTFQEGRVFDHHLMMHTGEKPWRCPVCGKGFVQEKALNKHMNIHSGENKHQCEVCHRTFVDKYGLIKHSTIHTGERPYGCSICGRTFRVKKGLDDHYKLHDRNLQLHCPLCPKSFVERRHLEHHLRVHRGEKAYVCEICGDRFVNSVSLKVHLRIHTGEKPYKCQYCGKTFNQHGAHAAHERFHRGERPFQCDMCDAAFITRSQLTIHKRKHLNIRPYKCSQCDYAATTSSLLKVHMLKHSNEKPFRCSVCPAAFKRKNHLDVHFRKHQARHGTPATGPPAPHTNVVRISGVGAEGLDPTHAAARQGISYELMYQCTVCEAMFASQVELQGHMKRHEIVVVTAGQNQDGGMFDIPPAIEGAHGASSEVAYDIVLL